MIIFQNKRFPTRELNLKGWGNVLVSTTDLNKLVYNDDGYTSVEAQNIDEQIFFYVSPDEINLIDRKLSKIIRDSL